MLPGSDTRRFARRRLQLKLHSGPLDVNEDWPAWDAGRKETGIENGGD
jgi:hypothetical protein